MVLLPRRIVVSPCLLCIDAGTYPQALTTEVSVATNSRHASGRAIGKTHFQAGVEIHAPAQRNRDADIQRARLSHHEGGIERRDRLPEAQVTTHHPPGQRRQQFILAGLPAANGSKPCEGAIGLLQRTLRSRRARLGLLVARGWDDALGQERGIAPGLRRGYRRFGASTRQISL